MMHVFSLWVQVPNIFLHPIRGFNYFRIGAYAPGLVAILEVDLRHVLMVFATRGHAERAQCALYKAHVKFGQYIMNAIYCEDNHKIKIFDPVDGWPEGISAVARVNAVTGSDMD